MTYKFLVFSSFDHRQEKILIVLFWHIFRFSIIYNFRYREDQALYFTFNFLKSHG